MESRDDILLECEEKMVKSIDALKNQFSGLRTGKASPALVENIQISYYGSSVKLRELAGISTPDARLIVLNPFDPTALQAIEKAILSANIGITPLNDGRVIRLPVPELSEERRKELAKVAKQMAEKARMAVRNIRQEANEQIKALQKRSVITEDERDLALKDIQKNTDEYNDKISQILESKEKEMMTV